MKIIASDVPAAKAFIRGKALRSVARIRTTAPAAILALGVAAGQGIVWFCGGVPAAIIVACLGAWLWKCAPKGRGGLAVAIILGALATIPLVVEDRAPLSGTDVVIGGRVEGLVRRRSPGEVTFEVVSRTTHMLGRIRCRAIDLPWRNSADLQAGDFVWIRGSCKAVERPANPFSWQGWLWRRGVGSECRARYISKPEHVHISWLQRARNEILERARAVAGDTRGTALLLSMALGYQDILSAPVERAFMTLGLTHLLVVSGYQVSLVFGCIVSILSITAGLVGKRILSRSFMMVVAFVAAAGYVCLIGAEMSSVRALIAAGCVCGQLLTERGGRFSQRWGLALLCMQLIWPWCVYEIGVVLTFTALLGIGVGSSGEQRHRLISYAWVTLVVWTFTSCVVVLWSGAFSPMGVIVNFILAAPWSILNCTVGMIGLSLALIGVPGGGELLHIVVWINTIISQALITIADYPFSGFTFEMWAHRALAGGVLLLVAALCITRSMIVRRQTLDWDRGSG